MNRTIAEVEDEPFAAPDRYDIVKAAPPPAFDEIASLAAALCDVPFAAIKFVDTPHDCTRAVGFPSGFSPDKAFHWMHPPLAADRIVITDLSADPRFKDLPMVRGEPFIRFYAAVPLETPEGSRIGELCIFDRHPRTLADKGHVLLKALARRVIAELDLTRALKAEREARAQAEQLLAEQDNLLARNNVLLHEVDHRVKNSLQLVSSMLSIQARRLPVGEASRALEEARKRIASIAAVHEQIYRVSSSDVVDMSTFLEGLCASLAAHRPGNIQGIDVSAKPVELGSKRAMKIGLLVAELVLNGFKHAYPAGRTGTIRVSLTATDGTLRLIVADDGVGLPEGFDPETGNGLGMRLIRSILNQFGGTISIESGSGSGSRFVIDMPQASPG